MDFPSSELSAERAMQGPERPFLFIGLRCYLVLYQGGQTSMDKPLKRQGPDQGRRDNKESNRK